MNPLSLPINHRMMSHTAMCLGSMFFIGVLISQPSALAADVGSPAPSGGAVGAPLPPGEAAQYRAQPQAPRGQLALTVGVPVFHDKFVDGELTVSGTR